MPESLLDRRLKLGKYLGIDLYVHWTFALVIAYVAFASSETGADGMAFAIAQLLGVFLCVTLHEYGHAMAAREFGIATADITLLPIGGVARLKRMPRIPWQELVVAVAGPAVNVVIGTLLVAGFFVLTDLTVLDATLRFFIRSTVGLQVDEQTIATVTDVFTAPSIAGFAVTMLIVNIMLVLFNMIPAFPMDGGRVFRSVLAMGIDYRRATRIASRVGVGCAAVLAVLALSADPPRWIPVMIAAFVAYAGMAEARQVELMESVRGLTVSDVMVRTTDGLPMDLPLGQVVARWNSSQVAAMPVVSIVGTVVGMLDLREVQRAVVTGVNLQTPAGQLINHQSPVHAIRDDEPLEAALVRNSRQRRQIPVVNVQGQLSGIVDLDTMILRSELAKAMRHDQQYLATRFDQSS